ncbi:sugar ABC transporter substrate-binding protein, partial [Francisella sp. 19S2-10]|nr:sugar ABC transporter substrate-binding protein [Francisella sp. 19S2-4]MED7830870.1 sugar ABC transporter substrate-binding protein [Francisella sp. 19S2-10]
MKKISFNLVVLIIIFFTVCSRGIADDLTSAASTVSSIGSQLNFGQGGSYPKTMSSGSTDVVSDDAGLASVTAMDPGHRIEDRDGSQFSN